jgi:hypothetical protein
MAAGTLRTHRMMVAHVGVDIEENSRRRTSSSKVEKGGVRRGGSREVRKTRPGGRSKLRMERGGSNGRLMVNETNRVGDFSADNFRRMPCRSTCL